MSSAAADTPWWALRFEQLAALDAIFAGPIDERAEQEVEFLARLVQLKPGARVLDVGCGGGRHSILFAERGHAVTGVDLSPRILRIAREQWETRQGEKLTEENPPSPVAVSAPNWMPGDMRWLPASPPSDVAIILDGSFGMFDDDAEHLRVLGSVADLLRPGGKIVLQVPNPYHWSGRARAQYFAPGMLTDDTDVIHSYRFDAMKGRIEDRVVVFRDGVRHEPPAQSLRAWTPLELVALLRAAGLHHPRVYGSEGWAVPEEPLPVHPTESVWLWATAQA
jgi:SAM-dependent methyltransferase